MEKVEVVPKNNGNSQPLVLAEMSSEAVPAVNEQMDESLRVLSEETLQLSELVWQESKLTKEFCMLVKHVLRQLNISFNLPVNVFPRGQKLQQVILNSEAHLILINDKNEVESKALEDCSSEVVFNLVSFIIPTLSKSLTLYRQKINVRIELYDKVNRELRNLRNMTESRSERQGEGNGVIENGVKKTLMDQQKPSDQQPTQ